MNKKVLLVFLSLLTVSVLAQVGRDGEEENVDFKKIFSIQDRAGGTHNASNIGLFFENRGKLYPRRITQGPSGEFPINSGNHYIYRINPMVGIPGNVIQGRYTTNEEWEAVGGYQNPELSQIAFSDKPETWHPVNGWPVKDSLGNPILLSDQDSYCAYNDSNNTISILNIQVEQIGYTYGVKFAQDMIFFKYIITNNSSLDYDSLYFGLYTDLDIGNVSGGAPEYGDDKINFIKNKNFLYFYDADDYSSEWAGGKVGMMGVAFLKTPEVNGVQLGITDMHYNEYNDDRDIDTIQYGIMASSPSLYNSSLGSKYFHLGSNTALNYCDVNTIPATGLDLVANVSSGPYLIKSGEKLVFYTAIIAGETETALLNNLDQAYKILEYNFEVSKPPATPTLYSFAGDKEVVLYWNDIAEYSKDSFSGEYDFEGYRLYKSLNKGITWQLIADFDKINDIGLDRGLQYSYTDKNVVNGIEYWYSITAYDRGDEFLESLESPKGSNTDAINLNAVTPVSSALGRTPVTSQAAENIGTGSSNYLLVPGPVDNESLTDNIYEVFFNYTTRTEKGKLKTKIEVTVFDSSKTKPHQYGIVFKTDRIFDIVNLTTGDVLKEDNTYIPRAYPGIKYSSNGSVLPGIEFRIYDPNPSAPSDSLPAPNDRLVINYSINAIKNSTDVVLKDRPFDTRKVQSTEDGIILQMKAPDIIESVSRVGGTDNFEIEFSVDDESLIIDALFLVSVTGNGFDGSNGFVSLLIKKDNIETNIDSVKNLDAVYFNGIKGVVKFPSNNPPSPGNIISIKTIIPVEPGIRERYRFKINAPSVSSEKVKQEISKIKVVPNPYIVSSLYEIEYGELRQEPLRQIQFINLPPECTIYIFTVDADLVQTIYHSSTTGTAVWDLRAAGGRVIAPGVYIYVVKTKDTEYIERFAVIK
ncbi:MAG TPA: hypothetical protein PK397_11140 [Ignavibacteriaceae bacterium]|nr:hypothetical protein [Ignavibacteriaceae bacterium]